MEHRKLFEAFTNKKKKLTTEDEEGKSAVPTKVKAGEDAVVSGEFKELAGPQAQTDAMQKLEEEKQPAFKDKQCAGSAAFSSSEDDKQDEMEQKEFTIVQSPITGCQHECILPVNYVRKGRGGRDGIEWDKTKPRAKEYKFTLDPFQQASIECLERNESVLVAAHTSAGKTVVAEYAIAMALKSNQRVIYTSPIKALSNQKYREFAEEFQDVGLMTGDVTLNPHASCLVMTTEILRNMLYKGSEVVREMAWVIFDEIHYMRDKERGVVWEETIILVSTAVKYVFLSATIQNAREFAQWICKIKSQPCNVVYTDFRPVPLQHYICPKGGEGIYLVVDEHGDFKEEHFNQAIAVLDQEEEPAALYGKARKKQNRTSAPEIKKIVNLIVEEKLDPCIIFSFSKDECEKHILGLASMDLTNEEEKKQIEVIYTNAITTLSEEDQQLKMITNILPLLKKGLGIHHGGLLPILKEVIEILFQEGLIKVIFTTETFSLGINMPAKSVVFTSIEKFDGQAFRWIGGGEYIQMSGRAGRRGIDERGTCILMADKRMDTDVAKGILKGKPDPLMSAFYLSYNMLLNMQRIEDMDPAYLITRSFYQYQRDQALPRKREELKNLRMKLHLIDFPEAKTVSHYVSLTEEMKRLNVEINKRIIQPQNVLPYLSPGRLIHVADEEADWGWGIVVNFTKKRIEPRFKRGPGSKPESTFSQLTEEIVVVDTMLYVQNKLSSENTQLPGSVEAKNGSLGVIAVNLPMISELSKVKMKMLPDIRSREGMATTEKLYLELMKRFNCALPVMDPEIDLEIDDPELKLLRQKRQILSEKLKVASVGQFSPEDIARFEEVKKLKQDIKGLKTELKQGKKMVLHSKLKSMQRVLRRLDFCDKNSILTKGKVACEISVGDELLTTELLFSGVFNSMQPAILGALLSCVIYTEHKSEEKMTKNAELQAAFGQLKETAEKIGKIKAEIDVNQPLDEYMNQFKPDLMDLTFEWGNGTKFGELCKMTNIYEGTIIRCFRRLDELVKELINAAKVIGNTQIAAKLDEVSKTLRRDIVFAASLYFPPLFSVVSTSFQHFVSPSISIPIENAKIGYMRLD